ncbi:MAG: S-adenosylmethionine decarboxylase proenzyme precursor [Pseudomonadota bacterium]|jgi:S-adenosylmethionine decarboxylase
MSGGTEWLVDAFGCDPVRLASPAALIALSDGVIARLGLHVLGSPAVHHFPPPGGVTGLYLLSESHWAWHTYPESELATFNLYCCRARPPLDWSAVLGAALGAQSVDVKSVPRGLGSVRVSSPPESARTWVHLPGSGK